MAGRVFGSGSGFGTSADRKDGCESHAAVARRLADDHRTGICRGAGDGGGCPLDNLGIGNWYDEASWAGGHAPDFVSGADVAFIDADGVVQIRDTDVARTLKGIIGSNAPGAGTVEVLGLNSRWNNYADLFVGDYGVGILRIMREGHVSVGNRLWVGYNRDADGTIKVDGIGSSLDTAYLNIGGSGKGLLEISNGGKVQVQGGSYLGTLADGSGTALVTGSGSLLDIAEDLRVGYSSDGVLRIESGGVVKSANGFVGSAVSPNRGSGVVTVTGAGSKWSIGDKLTIGEYGDGAVTIAAVGRIEVVNNVTNGILVGGFGKGTVHVTSGGAMVGRTVLLADHSGSSGTILLDGIGSSLTTTDTVDAGIRVGDDGNGLLDIRNGATATSASSVALGVFAPGVGTIAVDGTGSKLTTAADLIAGNEGKGTLTISNGGAASASTIAIGKTATGQGSVLLDGVGSRLVATNTSGGLVIGMVVGERGKGLLDIRNGATASAFTAALASETGGEGKAIVTGAGSGLNVDSNFFVGLSGAGTLEVRNGGKVEANSATFGAIGLSTGTALIDGKGSSLVVRNELAISNTGNATMTVSNGAQLLVGTEAGIGVGVGYDPVFWNQLTITGAETLLSTDRLKVGINGRGKFVVENGGTVRSTSAVLGELAFNNDTNGWVIVQGAGSNWVNTNALVLGDAGRAAMRVDVGASVTTGSTSMGKVAGGYGQLLVTDVGSSWTTGHLEIGGVGKGLINVTRGATLTSSSATLAEQDGASLTQDGYALVQNAGSRWLNSGNLTIGGRGGAELVVARGGLVQVGGTVTIARDAGSTGTLFIGDGIYSNPNNAGTFDAKTMVFGAGTGALSFEHNNADYVFAPSMSGNGTIEHKGPGTTILTGDSSALTGTTTVSAGTLRVDGGFGSRVTASAGTIAGSGSIQELTLGNGARLAPGGGAGDNRLNILSDLRFGAGSIFEVGVGGAKGDRVDVGNDAYLGGATVQLVRNPGAVRRQTILTAAHQLNGNFGTFIGGNYAFVTPSLVYNGNEVAVDFARNGVAFASFAQTPNQIATARALDALPAGSAIQEFILGTNGSEAAAAFDALSGEGHGAITTGFVQSADQVGDLLFDRLDASYSEYDGGSVVSGYAAGAGLPEAGGDNRLWGQFYGGFGDRRGSVGLAGTQFGAGGLLMGVDTSLNGWQVGVSTQLGSMSVAVPDRNMSATSGDLGLGVFAGTHWGDTGLSLTGTLTRNALSTTRNVTLPGLTETLKADYGALTGQVMAELDHEFDFGAVSLTPYVRLGHTVHTTDPFAETGGTAALTGAGSMINQSFAALGLGGSYQFIVGDGGLAEVSGSLAWRHSFVGGVTSNNAFAGGASFGVSSTPLAADTLLVGGGVTLDMASGIDLSLNYSGELSNVGQAHVFKAGVGGKF